MVERAKFTYRGNPRWRISNNVNISGLDEDISTKFGVQMHYGHLEIIAYEQKSKPEVNSRDVIK